MHVSSEVRGDDDDVYGDDDDNDDADKERCCAPIDRRGVHFHLCQVGTARFRPHRAVLVRLAKLFKAAGAHVDIERACPELYQRLDETGARGNQVPATRWKEAILDVVAKFPGGNTQYKLDVTLRSAYAESYGTTHTCVGLAAAAGERHKLDRYGPTVLPIAFETLGRMGPASVSCMESLLLEAQVWGRERFNPVRTMAQWRLALETTLAYEVAEVALQNLGGCPGVLEGLG